MTSWNVCKYRTSPRIPRCFVKKAFAPPPKSYPMTLLLTAVWLSDTRSRTRPTPLTIAVVVGAAERLDMLGEHLHQPAAADRLGIPRTTLHSLMKKLGISRSDL